MANEKKTKIRVINKHDSEKNWARATNFIPYKGEIIIYDADETHSVPRMKIGDGKTTVTELSFIDRDLEENVQEEVDKLISCGTTDPDVTTVGKFYFKYSN